VPLDGHCYTKRLPGRRCAASRVGMDEALYKYERGREIDQRDKGLAASAIANAPPLSSGSASTFVDWHATSD
jgi:hypothetical protein